MDRSSKLVDLALVSKYYPVANYSYPRNDSIASYGARESSDGQRSSLGSESSAPGLVDDHTDSENEDDSQYHSHTAELWDSFWQHGYNEKKTTEPVIQPRKQYPALLPSPQHKWKRLGGCDDLQTQSWPLPNSATQERRRKPAATYSAFPKPVPMHPKPAFTTPSWQSSRSSIPIPKLQRPHRPADLLLSPGFQLPAPSPAALISLAERPATPYARRPITPLPHRPRTSLERRPATSQGHRAATSLESREPLSAASSYQATHLSNHEPSRHNVPMNMSKVSCPALRPALRPESEPQSFFEYDDDEESEPHVGRYFFRFPRRSEGDNRRAAKSEVEEDAPAATGQRRRRNRASTVPPSPRRPQQEPERTSQDRGVTARRKRPGGGDVLGRMLGRLSR